MYLFYRRERNVRLREEKGLAQDKQQESGLEASAVIPEAELFSLYTCFLILRHRVGCGLCLGHTAK